jgi:hypothetical protein
MSQRRCMRSFRGAGLGGGRRNGTGSFMRLDLSYQSSAPRQDLRSSSILMIVLGSPLSG